MTMKFEWLQIKGGKSLRQSGFLDLVNDVFFIAKALRHQALPSINKFRKQCYFRHHGISLVYPQPLNLPRSPRCLPNPFESWNCPSKQTQLGGWTGCLLLRFVIEHRPPSDGRGDRPLMSDRSVEFRQRLALSLDLTGQSI